MDGELTEAEQRLLAANGYLLIPSVLDSDAVDNLARHLRRMVRDMWDNRDTRSEKWEEMGVARVPLDVHDPRYKELVEHPLLFGAAEAVVGPGCRVNGLSMRAPLPGFGQQGLHPDFAERQTSGPWQVLAAMWYVSEITQDNGPLRVIPGSHRSARDPNDDMEWISMGPHPNEVKLVGPAGSLILFNSASLWHSGTLNYSAEPRLAVTAYLGPPQT